MNETDCEQLIKTLYVEDDPEDAEELRAHLHAVCRLGGPRYFVTGLHPGGKLPPIAAFAEYDVVLFDYFLGYQGDYRCTCESLLGELRANHPGIAAIVTSNSPNLDCASSWLSDHIRAGRIGFIWKGLWTPGTLHRTIEAVRRQSRRPERPGDGRQPGRTVTRRLSGGTA